MAAYNLYTVKDNQGNILATGLRRPQVAKLCETTQNCLQVLFQGIEEGEERTLKGYTIIREHVDYTQPRGYQQPDGTWGIEWDKITRQLRGKIRIGEFHPSTLV